VLCFLRVAYMWALKVVLGVHSTLDSKWWQHVIRQDCFTWIDEVMDPGESYVANALFKCVCFLSISYAK
jgi:hypothetical protein